ncbi:glutathione-dependent formaldehyde-activating enzyme [Xylariaceae sp. FL0016]|nr:glutathione-dependent formaldehyde-activating enzyme [Xylariaceae sp. FL0016]
MASRSNLITYRGNCHCKAHVYTIRVSEITRADECDCSVCYKKAALWVFPQSADLTWARGGPDTLTNYTFGRKRFNHKFCPTCGISLMILGHLHPPKAGEHKEPEVGMNVRTLQHGQGIDTFTLERNPFDGRSLPPAYAPPEFTDTLPTADVEKDKLYTGSCHCGAVRVALKSKSLDQLDSDAVPDALVECNCSFCGRTGAMWTYPKHEQVAVQGRENLASYQGVGRGFWSKSFCRTCGVHVLNELMPLTEEQLAGLSPETRAWTWGGKAFFPINLRVMNGVDVRELKTIKADGYGKIRPKYEEP